MTMAIWASIGVLFVLVLACVIQAAYLMDDVNKLKKSRDLSDHEQYHRRYEDELEQHHRQQDAIMRHLDVRVRVSHGDSDGVHFVAEPIARCSKCKQEIAK